MAKTSLNFHQMPAKFCSFLIFCGLTIPIFGSPLEFRFPVDISWQAVFDQGFRPKHVSGLEHTNTECTDQEVDLVYGGHAPFRLDRGRVVFELQIDDSIRIIEHVSRVPITMEEAARRLDVFHTIFADCMVRQGSLPILIDPERGGVMDVGDFSAVARKDGYTVSYRFIGAMNPRTPLIPVLMISKKYSMKDPQLPIRRKIVEPPPGYEWYSLDPHIDTPGPGIPAVAKPRVVPPGLSSGKPPQRLSPYMQELERKIERGIFGLVVGAICILLLPIIWWLVRGRAKNEG